MPVKQGQTLLCIQCESSVPSEDLQQMSVCTKIDQQSVAKISELNAKVSMQACSQ